MKRIFVLLLMMLSIGVSAQSLTKSMLIGKWQITKLIMEGDLVLGTLPNSPDNKTYVAGVEETSIYMTFQENGEMVMESTGSMAEEDEMGGSYAFDEQKQIIILDGEDILTVQFTNGILTLSDAEMTMFLEKR